MTYELEIHPKVAKFLRKLDVSLKKQIKRRLSLLEENPHHHLEQLQDIDHYKLRIGDYRALVDIDEKEKVVLIQHLGHRRNIYKK